MGGLSHLLNGISIPSLLTQFILTAVLSFTIGLELHSYHRSNQQKENFGSTRTFTLIGVLGFAFFIVSDSHWLYGFGFIGLVVFLALFYFNQAKQQNYSLISPLAAMLTYLLPALVISFPGWFVILYVVTLLLILSQKSTIRRFSDAFHSVEIVTFSKYLIMTGVILPLLPDREIYAPYITVTFYQVWLALLVVSSVSYAGYLMQTYLFRGKGLLLSGIVGGLYSSTATTIVLARRSTEISAGLPITNAIIIATVMMYLRLLLLISFLGHASEAVQLLRPFALLVVVSAVATSLFARFAHHQPVSTQAPAIRHPLEFQTAVLFALLFVVFAAMTQFVLANYGQQGLSFMSLLVGLTDIDPFILSLLAGKFAVSSQQIIAAIVIATASNNLIKAVYAVVIGRNKACWIAGSWLVFLALLSLVYVGLLL